MNEIEITVDQDALSLKTGVMTLRDALDACRSAQQDLDPTDSSSAESSAGGTQGHSNHSPRKSDYDMEPEVLYQEGATPLFKAIEEMNWRDALRLTEESPRQARIWVKSTGTQNTTFDWSLWRRLPAHEVSCCIRPFILPTICTVHS